ncbi:MAG: SIMPL domain-containing protein [Pseudomonadota bacterium]
MKHVISTKLMPALIAATILVQAACAQVPGTEMVHPNSIQPETTLNISSRASVDRTPDLAYINAGVETEARTAAEALSENAERMNGVFAALEAAGIEEKDIQTSNFNVSPNYDYSRDGPPRLVGYRATNQVRAKVSDLDNLGATLDSLVNAGGNTLNGIQFGLEDSSEALNNAREDAVTQAIERAELYAGAAGYSVGRIVSISEGGGDGNFQPPVAALSRAAADFESARSPVAAGELSFAASVNVIFELTKE